MDEAAGAWSSGGVLQFLCLLIKESDPFLIQLKLPIFPSRFSSLAEQVKHCWKTGTQPSCWLPVV